MARILTVGARTTLAERALHERLLQRLSTDGHDAAALDAEQDPVDAVRETDAVVALVDHLPAEGAAAVAFARAVDKPVLGLATRGVEVPTFLAKMMRVQAGDDERDWFDRLPAFYEDVRPFAGRVVRDRIPDLVREAGHDVTFRQLGKEERPRFLKQKVANEARALLQAEVADEKEKVADVLEAMEAFIASRAYERDDLRRVKEHKRKQRGGFERCFVVEATSTGINEPSAGAPAQATPTQTPPAPAPPAVEATQTSLGEGYEYTDEPVDETEPPEDLRPGKKVQAEFFEI